MADNYLPMGGVPDFYSSILNSAQQQLVRMPDGTLRAAPQISGPTSMNDIYGGIVPSSSASGSARLAQADPVGDLRASGGYNQLDDWITSGAYLQPNTGGLRVASAAPSIPGPRGSSLLTKDQSRLDPGTALAFAGEPTVPAALAAIQAIAPSIPLPRIRPRPSSDMQWQDTIAVPYDGGDPWAGKRIAPAAPKPGMVTGAAKRTGVPVLIRGEAPVRAPVITRSVAAPSSPQPVNSLQPVGASFLQAQGVDTSNMTAGQVANALNDSIRGAGAGQWH